MYDRQYWSLVIFVGIAGQHPLSAFAIVMVGLLGLVYATWVDDSRSTGT